MPESIDDFLDALGNLIYDKSQPVMMVTVTKMNVVHAKVDPNQTMDLRGHLKSFVLVSNDSSLKGVSTQAQSGDQEEVLD